MFDLNFKGYSLSDIGIKISKRPDIPAPQKRVSYIQIAGRDGNLLQSDNTYEDIVIPVDCNFIIEPSKWGQRFRQVKALLTGSGNLFFSDDTGVFYKCSNANIINNERLIKEAGEFTVEFTCYPYMYITSGQNSYSADDIRLNPYMTSHPIYQITGDGMCTLTVNGNEMTANVGQNLTIDTDLMIAYRQDGTMQNTAVTGDYENLYLLPGDNAISITDGFDLKIIPNWRTL